MTTKNLLYVHGAGEQSPPDQLKAQLDGILFDAPLATSRVAWYSGVRWGKKAPGMGAAPGAAGRARRLAAVKHASSRTVSPADAAHLIVTASLARGRGTGHLGAVPAKSRRDAVALVTKLYVHADRVAHHSGAHAGALGIGFPDFIFRAVVGRFASDVVDYLYGGYNEAMREPVRKALRDGPKPDVILAHSLGTIIIYDVLSEPEFAGSVPPVIVTAGCPLGIDNVQKRLRDGKGRPNPIPPNVVEWTNFGDRFDPVAIEAILRDQFVPKDLINDDAVDNKAKDNHDLTGYLAVGIIRTLVRHTVGV